MNSNDTFLQQYFLLSVYSILLIGSRLEMSKFYCNQMLENKKSLCDNFILNFDFLIYPYNYYFTGFLVFY